MHQPLENRKPDPIFLPNTSPVFGIINEIFERKCEPLNGALEITVPKQEVGEPKRIAAVKSS